MAKIKWTLLFHRYSGQTCCRFVVHKSEKCHLVDIKVEPGNTYQTEADSEVWWPAQDLNGQSNNE